MRSEEGAGLRLQYLLALKLGMTVTRLRHEMPTFEMEGWTAYLLYEQEQIKTARSG